MFFESHHSTEQNFFKITIAKSNPGFRLHIHKAYECYAVREGVAEVTVDGEKYTVGTGEAILVFPYQSHEYKTLPNTHTWVCIFSPDLVGSYNKGIGKAVPKNNKFNFVTDNIPTPDTTLLQKALCYNICGSFDKSAEYVISNRQKEELISKILVFISENYKASCTLRDAAAHAGYDYSYISKIFKKSTGLTFNTYVNNLRISEACRLLTHGGETVQDIAEQCGYTCTRTFHREFLRVMGLTPREYAANALQNPRKT